MLASGMPYAGHGDDGARSALRERTELFIPVRRSILDCLEAGHQKGHLTLTPRR